MKTILKAVAHGLAFMLILPLLASYWLRSLILGRDRALEGSSQALACVPGLAGQYLRRALLSRVIAHCDANAVIGFGTVFSKTGARIDENAYIGPYCVIGLVHLERDVLIASGVHIPSGGKIHGFDNPDLPIRDQPGRRDLVTIGAGAWIGERAVVIADVGRDSIVGAGSVVSRPLPDRVIAVGAPARVVRTRAEAAARSTSHERTESSFPLTDSLASRAHG